MSAPTTAETPVFSTDPLAWIRDRNRAIKREHEEAMRDPAFRADQDRRLRIATERFAALLRRYLEAHNRRQRGRPRPRFNRPARRRRRVATRSSAKSGDSGDEPEPPWPRRVAVRPDHDRERRAS